MSELAVPTLQVHEGIAVWSGGAPLADVDAWFSMHSPIHTIASVMPMRIRSPAVSAYSCSICQGTVRHLLDRRASRSTRRHESGATSS